MNLWSFLQTKLSEILLNQTLDKVFALKHAAELFKHSATCFLPRDLVLKEASSVNLCYFFTFYGTITNMIMELFSHE